MTNFEYVSLLQIKENELIKICNYFNLYSYDANDMIQDLYLVLLEFKNIDKYVQNKQPNMFIIFAILKNLIYHFRKKENKYSFVELYEVDISDEPEDNEKYDFLLDQIEKLPDLKAHEWYEKKLISMYINDSHTIRSLSKETKLTFSAIQPVIHKFKIKCQEEYKNQI